MLRSAYLSLVIGVVFASSVLAQSTGIADDSRSGAPEPTSEVCTEALSYEEYLELYAVDLNEDGRVDETDYKLWQENPFIGIAKDEMPVDDSFSYEDYLKIYGIDLNEDGQVDESDYRLWLEDPFIGIPGDGTPVELELKFDHPAIVEWTTGESLQITWVDLLDSRCAEGVTCIWEGQVTIVMGVIGNGQDLGEFEITLHAGDEEDAFAAVGKFAIQVIRVTPYPKYDVETERSDYAATLVISTKAPTPVEIPEESSFSYEDYLRIYGIDLNEDGRVDEADYGLWQEDPFRGNPIPAAVSSQSWGAIKKAASR